MLIMMRIMVSVLIGFDANVDNWQPILMRLSRLSQNIAGVTIMALGNGAPDIFSALAGIGQDRPELVFGEVGTLSNETRDQCKR